MTNEEAHTLAVGDRVFFIDKEGQRISGQVIKVLPGYRRILWDDGLANTLMLSTYSFAKLQRET